jgi:hypothetical protein
MPVPGGDTRRAPRPSDGPAEVSAGPSGVPGAGERSLSSSDRTAGRWAALTAAMSPVHVVAMLGVLLLTATAHPSIVDIDSYWHVEIGREILATGRTTDLGTSWLGVPAPGWQTSQWLSEVGMALAVDAGGWRALVLGRIALMALIVVLLGLVLLPRRPALVTAPVVLAVALSVTAAIQDRPQTVSLLFVALLAVACVRIWTGHRRPPSLVIALCCLLWAQLHGLWVLAPAAFLLAGTGAWLDRGSPDAAPRAARHAVTAAAASLAGLLNPLGPASLLLPLRLRDAGADVIGEWQPTTLTRPFTVGLALLVILLVVAWVRSPVPVPRVELLWGLAWVCFGAMAFRNVAVSALMLAPVVVAAVDRAWGAGARHRSAPSGRREGTALLVVCALMLVGGVGAAVVRAARADPLADAPAVRIAERLAAEPQPVRVFNAYNASGTLVAFGGGNVRLAIDGRADLWGEARISRVTGAATLEPGWQQTVEEFDPDAFVLSEDTPLVQVLVREGDWRIDLRDGDYVLLLPST